MRTERYSVKKNKSEDRSMAKRKIVWTETANIERLEILEYWISRNQSKSYSIKLNRLLNKTVRDLAEAPELGRRTKEGRARVKILLNYLLFYDFTDSELIILSIWDSRRDKSRIQFR